MNDLGEEEQKNWLFDIFHLPMIDNDSHLKMHLYLLQ